MDICSNGNIHSIYIYNLCMYLSLKRWLHKKLLGKTTAFDVFSKWKSSVKAWNYYLEGFVCFFCSCCCLFSFEEIHLHIGFKKKNGNHLRVRLKFDHFNDLRTADTCQSK